MEAYKQIAEVKNKKLQILLPDRFKDGKVEVIVLEIESTVKNKRVKKPSEYRNIISKESGKLLLDMVQESKSEWERGI